MWPVGEVAWCGSCGESFVMVACLQAGGRVHRGLRRRRQSGTRPGLHRRDAATSGRSGAEDGKAGLFCLAMQSRHLGVPAQHSCVGWGPAAENSPAQPLPARPGSGPTALSEGRGRGSPGWRQAGDDDCCTMPPITPPAGPVRDQEPLRIRPVDLDPDPVC